MPLSKPSFVSAAEISAHLFLATQVAKRISLTAKNARAITARAGRLASGFKAITDFIEELAKLTMDNAEIINKVAIEISRLATQQARNQQAIAIINGVFAQPRQPAYVESLRDAQHDTQQLIDDASELFSSQIKLLDTQLEETQRQTRSAIVISSTAKVEASQSGSFQQQLDAIADDIDTAAAEIKTQLRAARLLLRTLQDTPHESY